MGKLSKTEQTFVDSVGEIKRQFNTARKNSAEIQGSIITAVDTYIDEAGFDKGAIVRLLSALIDFPLRPKKKGIGIAPNYGFDTIVNGQAPRAFREELDGKLSAVDIYVFDLFTRKADPAQPKRFYVEDKIFEPLVAVDGSSPDGASADPYGIGELPSAPLAPPASSGQGTGNIVGQLKAEQEAQDFLIARRQASIDRMKAQTQTDGLRAEGQQLYQAEAHAQDLGLRQAQDDSVLQREKVVNEREASDLDHEGRVQEQQAGHSDRMALQQEKRDELADRRTQLRESRAALEERHTSRMAPGSGPNQ
jgi:hypothetical protein